MKKNLQSKMVKKARRELVHAAGCVTAKCLMREHYRAARVMLPAGTRVPRSLRRVQGRVVV